MLFPCLGNAGRHERQDGDDGNDDQQFVNVNLKACFIVFLLILNLHAWIQKLLIHYI